jgi:hypothetical protein
VRAGVSTLPLAPSGGSDAARALEAIWKNEDRAYDVSCLVKRLHRVDKEMSGQAREAFAAYLPEGDVTAFARGLSRRSPTRTSRPCSPTSRRCRP